MNGYFFIAQITRPSSSNEATPLQIFPSNFIEKKKRKENILTHKEKNARWARLGPASAEGGGGAKQLAPCVADYTCQTACPNTMQTINHPHNNNVFPAITIGPIVLSSQGLTFVE